MIVVAKHPPAKLSSEPHKEVLNDHLATRTRQGAQATVRSSETGHADKRNDSPRISKVPAGFVQQDMIAS